MLGAMRQRRDFTRMFSQLAEGAELSTYTLDPDDSVREGDFS